MVADLGDRLELRVRLSAAADTKHGDDPLTLEKGRVTGAEALTAVAQVAGLVVEVKDGDLVLALRDEAKAEPVDEFDF